MTLLPHGLSSARCRPQAPARRPPTRLCKESLHLKTLQLILASIALLFTFSGAVEAASGTKKQLSAPAGAMEALAAGRSQDLIVEFDSSTVQAEADKQRQAARLHKESPEILAFKAARYRDIKRSSFARLAPSEHQVIRDYSHLPMALVRFKHVNALKALLADPALKAIYKDEVKRPVLDSTSLSLVSQPAVVSQGFTGAGTTVAVIDTGVNYTQADFGCTSPGVPSSCKVNYYQNFASGASLDSNGHGTNVSGIVVGVSPSAKVAGLNVFGASSTTTDSLVISAINWAIANRATYNIVAINMSLGDGINHSWMCSSSPYITPVNNADSAGIDVVAAAGNEGFTDGISSPACVFSVIKAGAVYSANIGAVSFASCSDSTTAADKITCFSNFAPGAPYYILAPGVNQSAGGYTQSGTSQAAPYISGAIAILRSAVPDPTAEQQQGRSGYVAGAGGPAVTVSRGGTSTWFYRLDILQSLTPAGDSFATPISTLGSFYSNNIIATKETGEPNHAGNSGGKSVWVSFTSDYNTRVSVDTHLSNFDTLLAVYTGNSVSALTSVASNDNDGSPNGNSGIVFQAQSGATYHIAVDGKNGASGLFVFDVKYAPPANDNFSARTAISGSSGQATGLTVAATSEADEPSHAGLPPGNSAWWSWTAPAAGQVTIDTHGSGIGTVLAAYTGTSVNGLTSQAVNDNDGSPGGTSGILFPVQSGAQYQIVVEGNGGAQGNVVLNWSLNTNPTANLSLSIAGYGDTSSGVTYSGTVGNTGPGIAVNSRLTLTLPAGVTFQSSPSGCSANGATVTCAFGNLPPGASVTFTIVGNVSAPGNYTASASVTSDVTDPVASNNSASLTTDVTVADTTDDDIPTMPEWGMIIMSIVLTMSMMIIDKKRRAQS